MKTVLLIIALIPLNAYALVAETPPCATPSKEYRLELNGYLLTITPPENWCASFRHGELALFDSRPTFVSYIGLGWSLPHSERGYSDFAERVLSETEVIRERHEDVVATPIHVGELSAVEVRSLDPLHRRWVQIFIGVPLRDSWGDLFVIVFHGPNEGSGLEHLSEFEHMVKSLQLSREEN